MAVLKKEKKIDGTALISDLYFSFAGTKFPHRTQSSKKHAAMLTARLPHKHTAISNEALYSRAWLMPWVFA